VRRGRPDHGVARVAACALVAGALLTVAGCRFGVLGQHVRTLDANGYLRGTVSQPAGEAADPVVVFAVRAGETSGDAVDWVVLSRRGPYFLVVPVGDYRVGAFVDHNHSLTLDAGEAAVWVHGGAAVSARPGETTGGLNLALTDQASAVPVAVSLLERASAGINELPSSRLGEVVAIDDPRFSPAAARVGLWRPVEFLVDVGAGIYFLEPYDPNRTPVLFVHGALGNPRNFSALIASLDHSRFQAWVAYYPSAVRLDVVGQALGRWLQALEVEYGFHRLGLVAHSMGGLVARSYLAGDPYGLGGTIDALSFVSIATPWQGHAAAALGVARAPVPAPSWFDLAPDSPFLNRLLASPLPPYAVHDLYFAYGGSRRSRTANDGVVTVASQLDLRMQDQARRVVGFDAQHAAVLDDPAVADELRHSLASLDERR
jgi:pimeloyl-ACP methyl ester carboxylesterase